MAPDKVSEGKLVSQAALNSPDLKTSAELHQMNKVTLPGKGTPAPPPGGRRKLSSECPVIGSGIDIRRIWTESSKNCPPRI